MLILRNNSGRPLPLTFEDRTADITNSDFDEMYERCFYHVGRQAGHTTTTIHEMINRYSRFRSTIPITHSPIILLEFNADESLGNISFLKAPQFNVSMSRYLKKTSFFGSSLSRKFTATDGQEYKWGFRTTAGQEWSCTKMDNTLVAHYDLKPPEMPVFDTSGNNLIIDEEYGHLIPEILSTFIIMRHIAKFNL